MSIVAVIIACAALYWAERTRSLCVEMLDEVIKLSLEDTKDDRRD